MPRKPKQKRQAKIILCNFFKGGCGKTTLSVHIAGLLSENIKRQVLLMDCVGKPKSWSFFKGSSPQSNQSKSRVSETLYLLWNPPRVRMSNSAARFQPLKKSDYEPYDYVVIDSDSPPEDAISIIGDTLPNIILVPVSLTQAHAVEDIPEFLDLLIGEIYEQSLGLDEDEKYLPLIRIVPLGLNRDDIIEEIDIEKVDYPRIDIFRAMMPLQDETIQALKQKKFVWNLEEALSSYLFDYIEGLVEENL
jgi:chromosome partitioning protein